MSRKFTYPEARQDEVVENYHGTPVADPYRWMEDPENTELAGWVEAENQLTFDYLAEIPARAMLHRRLTTLYDFPKTNAPESRNGRYFFAYNDGLQNQPVLQKQDGLEGDPQPILDPNTLSEDGTVALMIQAFNDDGTLLAYSISAAGSDWQEIRIRNVDTLTEYDEILKWCKFPGIAWSKDSSGFYYNRFPAPEGGENDTQIALNNALYWHKLGTPQADDMLIFERPDAPELNFTPEITDDGQYLVLNVWHGAVNRNRIYYREVESDGDFVRLLDEPNAEYTFVGNEGSVFYFQTDLDAPRSQLIAIDTANPAREHWRVIVPEQDDVILSTKFVNRQIVVVMLHQAYYQIKIYALDGAFVGDVPLPGMGSIFSIEGKRDGQELFVDFRSHLYPPTIFRYDFATGEMKPWRQPTLEFSPDDYETKQVWYPSKDGTQVSMFITAKKGLVLNGENPTLLYGYGGFSIPLAPDFASQILSWISSGGIYAVANLRGGSEYGEAWHQAGMLANKQNVFDDFIAAAEWLTANHYTKPKKLAIMGRSNGGLLVAACMLQRPDLFGAVICGVPVTDMLRYHKFTAGRYWTYEYGNAEENAEDFKFLLAYSPIHNIKKGVTYPPTLITTADHDDRVVPMHAKKFAAALQANDAGNHPILLRLDMKSGHGMGKPTSKWIDEWADIQAFLFQALEMGQ